MPLTSTCVIGPAFGSGAGIPTGGLSGGRGATKSPFTGAGGCACGRGGSGSFASSTFGGTLGSGGCSTGGGGGGGRRLVLQLPLGDHHLGRRLRVGVPRRSGDAADGRRVSQDGKRDGVLVPLLPASSPAGSAAVDWNMVTLLLGLSEKPPDASRGTCAGVVPPQTVVNLLFRLDDDREIEGAGIWSGDRVDREFGWMPFHPMGCNPGEEIPPRSSRGGGTPGPRRGRSRVVDRPGFTRYRPHFDRKTSNR